ncbi:MAG TPA: DUF3526 domain-containing protein, partial [Archangium sp.]|nr:DUF3526 domain-containing protein [Archangium sp.]
REGLAEVGVRLPLLAASYGLYVVVCAAAAVLVSSWHRRTSSALLSLLALWMGLWVVVPRAATQVAGWLHPAPSRATFERTLEAALRSAGDSHQPTSPAFIELKERLLREHGVERVEELPFNFGGVVMREGEAATSQVMNEHHERLYAAFHAQDRLALLLSALNPMLALRSWSMALAGTDSHHAASFQRQAEAHRYGFIQRLNALHTHEIRWQNDRAQRLDARRWKEFPPFHYERPALGWALGNVTLAGAALVGWAAVLLGMLLVGRRGGLA